jgi:hypothetical protein
MLMMIGNKAVVAMMAGERGAMAGCGVTSFLSLSSPVPK